VAIAASVYAHWIQVSLITAITIEAIRQITMMIIR
jgi:hypothetical protein